MGLAKFVERVCPGCKEKKSYDRRKKYCSQKCYDIVRAGKVNDSSDLAAQIQKLLKRRGPVSMQELTSVCDRGAKQIEIAIAELRASGFQVELKEDRAELVRDVPAGGVCEIDPSIYHGKKIRFGFTTDWHLCSKYARLDALNMLYDLYAEEKIPLVFHAGNLIDGECRFNNFDLLVRGMENQIAYAVENSPKRKGIETQFICGDDHEGWYVQREGINIGKLMQDRFNAAGRTDMKYIGYLEADVLIPSASGRGTRIRVIHPGGGTAYALSYTSQKLTECVPLDSEILTRSGWKKHDEIEVGDEVLGYNLESHRCEWTELRAINRYDDTEVVSYENDQFKVRCTRNHKWAMEWESRGGKNPASLVPTNYARRDRVMSTIDEAKERSHIIQAAPGPDGEGIRFDEHLSILDRQFTVESVLKMTSLQRQSFIYGMMAGEGCFSGDGNTPTFSQRPGPVQDAFVLACFLEGRATGIARLSSKKINGEEKICCRTTILKKPTRMVTRSLREVSSKIESVWCPTTGLGTWVMRQGSVVTITGNSFQGGEKPDLLLVGHYHKMDMCLPREVFTVQGGCMQDQTPFMRKNKIQAHVGGWICELTQAPDGHISRFKSEFIRFFDRGFYEGKEKFGRW